MYSLEAKLKQSEKKNNELQKEIKTLNKIQHEQSKALERIESESGQNREIQYWKEQARAAKEKLRELEERHKRGEKTMK